MTRLILFLILLSFAGITAAWIAENPGNVTMLWFDYQIETSFAFILLITIICALSLASITLFLNRILRAPQHFSRHRSKKNVEKGLAELTHSLVALAASDSKAAELHTNKAEKFLGRTPLTLLLSAQISRTKGDSERTQQLLEQMLEHKETEYLAARYLSEAASQQQQLPQARDMARRAHNLNPKDLEPLLSIHIRLMEWQQAIIAIQKALRKGQITRAQLHHYKAMVFAQQALSLLASNQNESALAAALQALKENPDSLPIINIAARAQMAQQQEEKAVKILTHAWQKNPHMLLVETFRSAISRLPKDKQKKLSQKLIKKHPNAYASHMLLAQTYLAIGDWAQARAETKRAITITETSQACKLMADIEMAEFSDYDARGRWLTRSVNALPDGSWLCNSCSATTKHWATHCPTCHNFDTLEWKQRELTFVG